MVKKGNSSEVHNGSNANLRPCIQLCHKYTRNHEFLENKFLRVYASNMHQHQQVVRLRSTCLFCNVHVNQLNCQKHCLNFQLEFYSHLPQPIN